MNLSWINSSASLLLRQCLMMLLLLWSSHDSPDFSLLSSSCPCVPPSLVKLSGQKIHSGVCLPRAVRVDLSCRISRPSGFLHGWDNKRCVFGSAPQQLVLAIAFWSSLGRATLLPAPVRPPIVSLQQTPTYAVPKFDCFFATTARHPSRDRGGYSCGIPATHGGR